MENLKSKEDQIKKILYSRIKLIKKKIVFFIFAIKIEMLTIPEKCLENTKKYDGIMGKSINLKKISLGFPEKKSSGKFRYTTTPILFEEKPFQIVECGTGKRKWVSFSS